MVFDRRSGDTHCLNSQFTPLLLAVSHAGDAGLDPQQLTQDQQDMLVLLKDMAIMEVNGRADLPATLPDISPALS